MFDSINKIFRNFFYRSRSIRSILGLGYFVSAFQFRLLSFYKGQKFINLLKSIKKEVDIGFYPYEAYTVYSISKSQSRLSGEFAEVGVYQGGSARIICEVKGEKTLHLFDTFTGLPKVSGKDNYMGVKYWEDNQFNNTSEEQVKGYLSKFPNVQIYKGKFPETSGPVLNTQFSFVHLDVDLYQSTKDCLDFFYPRLVKGGIILTHDFHTSGVQTAFNDFFEKKQIPVIELTGSQCMIIKI